ncbi:MFS transporter [Kitasatospora sp. DSM 101779]|uniref:MFS transporter n=1 Tax=Kitasatospora sp. DSM 101779 TaxID=2853165 RepID=UPI0021DAE8BF|nr:MFS transporter [Kitasatospora sp. DSM 101779]MCU7822081.1 MFS transporter [Kitasatospora sp. DSM 101779]
MNRPALTLALSTTGAVLVAVDGTVLTVAQPTLQRDLHAGFAQVQWTSTGYLIAVASLLVLAGRLGDRYGHRRVFALGTLGFGAACAGIGLAPGIGWVVALRIVQGVCGALLQPATLGMLRAAYPPDRLATAIAVRTSAIGASAAVGPVLGGALVTAFGWRAVFALQVLPALAVGALALVARPQRGPARTTAAPVRLDPLGAALLGTGLACLVHTLVALPGTGWTTSSVLGSAAAAVAFTAFAVHERRAVDPLVPADLVRSPAVAASLGVLVAASAALFGTVFLTGYFLQEVLALDPLAAGLRALPLPVAMVLAAPSAALLQRRCGPRRTTAAATVLLAAGVLVLSRLDEASGVLRTGAGFLLLGAGFGTVMVTATAVVVRQAAAAHAGVAGGLQQTAMNIGPALGVAAATTAAGLATGGVHAAGPTVGTALGTAIGPALTVLALVAAAGTALTPALPRRTDAEVPGPTEEVPLPADPAPEPAR